MKRFHRYMFSTHKPVHHEAERRIRYYKEVLLRYYERRILNLDVSSVKLELDDEDVRYTTDPDPGIYDKVRCVEIFRALTRNPKEQFQSIMNKTIVEIWDVYSAPGMDVLYCMLIPYIFRDVMVHVTGVSLVKDVHDEKRFQRMEANVANMQSVLNKRVKNVNLVRGAAKDYCERYSSQPPDILILSPPWLNTHGEMKEGEEETARTVEDIGKEIDELVSAFYKFPKIISIMVPYGYKKLKIHIPVLGSRSSRYGLVESVKVTKKSSEDNAVHSQFYIHIVAQDYKDIHKKRDFVYSM